MRRMSALGAAMPMTHGMSLASALVQTINSHNSCRHATHRLPLGAPQTHPLLSVAPGCAAALALHMPQLHAPACQPLLDSHAHNVRRHQRQQRAAAHAAVLQLHSTEASALDRLPGAAVHVAAVSN